ncbi:alpha/beta hydrolase [Streptacidiphilus carbonis]|uniref:alpha/beta hydrolase n=1 Tax=Streptacidiphilus carbonis TaxID=105422 RepID=UPI0005A92E51|nr:alpha/beta fold hydrolase [Streptacidiphilus carbonis]
MTAFVLVAGGHIGGWVWREVVDRLQGSGARVYPATLTGLGDRRHLAGPGTDLDTHIEDLVQLIDQVDEPELVIVGHDTGIHPVLGAADRRPERIARIVHLDAGLPQDGESVLDLVPDPEVRERLLRRVGESGDGWRVPAPTLEEWPLWGSTAGVPEEALARLTRLAAPQPLATLTQPLRLTGAAAKLPTSGILCTANGTSIALVEMLLGYGEPRFQVLADPRVGFFELDTGHWPMLSCPDELAEVLLRAAAGEGHRVTAAGAEVPARFLLDGPERPSERIGPVDLYLPDLSDLSDRSGLSDLSDLSDLDGPRPAVVFVHGGPVPPEKRPTPRDSRTFVGYASQAAALGLVGVTLDHRLHGLGDYGRAAEDVAAAVELVRADPRVDADRIALWFFSGGGLLCADWLAAPPRWLRCVAATYPILAPLPNWGMAESRFRPADAVRGAGGLPMVLTRVELEQPEIAATVTEFLAAAEACGADVELIDVAGAHHGFETIDHTEATRGAVRTALRGVLRHLRAGSL